MDRSLNLWRPAGAEALAAFALVFAGCAAIIANTRYGGVLATTVGVALVFGLVIMVMVYAFGHLSGAHLNPAVTIAFRLTRHFSPRDALAYIAGQLTGATLAALLLAGIWTSKTAYLGATVPVYLAGPLLGASAGALAYQFARGEHHPPTERPRGENQRDGPRSLRLPA